MECTTVSTSQVTDDTSRQVQKILIIEDDPLLSGLLRDWLIFQKYSVDEVHDGMEGLERLTANKYDFVLLDCDLPNLSGIELLRQFRANNGTARVLLMTATRDSVYQDSAIQAGANGFIAKPFDLKTLLSWIQKVI